MHGEMLIEGYISSGGTFLAFLVILAVALYLVLRR